jgi:catechol 2,3-dioxygenase-like lactoylglutathione lyase family enzyme
MDVIFNFIGMCVSNWQQAFAFFTETLGLQAELNPAYGDWANLGGAWEGYYHETPSLICELFDQGRPVSERWWGKNQNVRPAIHVDDLDSTAARLRERGVNFTGTIEVKPWGRQIEFESVEGIRWALAQIPNKPVSQDLSRPHIGHIAIKTANFEAQKHFYGTKIGFILEDSERDYAIYAQAKPDHPFIILEQGGEAIQPETYGEQHPERSYPFFLSFMTGDIQTIAEECRTLGIANLRPLERHEDWGGTDIVITDADGNVIQIVQYG